MVAVEPTVLVLIASDNAPAQTAIAIERRRDIGHIALRIPASVAGADIAGRRFTVRTLTHHVDRCTWVTCAGHQAIGTAHHLDTIVDRGIFCGVAVVPRIAN